VSFLATIAKVAVAAVAVELRGVVRRFVRGLKGKAPHADPSQPLSHRDVEHQQSQIRGATTQRMPTMRPPPPPRRR
jgi:hypothetical protein